MRILPTLVSAALLASSCSATREQLPTASHDRELDLRSHFEGFDGTFVVMDIRTGSIERYNPTRAATRFSPCSTFKIVNALIGLDAGILDGPEHPLSWDGVKRGADAWNKDHTLRTAIRDSVVWYFQEVARRVGTERMAKYLRAFDYGNQDLSAGIDQFWLSTSLQISADEQVAFLRRLYRGELPVHPDAMQTVREILQLHSSPDGVLYGKTGSGYVGPDTGGERPSLGWFVGFFAKDDAVLAFALNIEGPGAKGSKAREIAESILVRTTHRASAPDRGETPQG